MTTKEFSQNFLFFKIIFLFFVNNRTSTSKNSEQQEILINEKQCLFLLTRSGDLDLKQYIQSVYCLCIISMWGSDILFYPEIFQVIQVIPEIFITTVEFFVTLGYPRTSSPSKIRTPSDPASANIFLEIFSLLLLPPKPCHSVCLKKVWFQLVHMIYPTKTSSIKFAPSTFSLALLFSKTLIHKFLNTYSGNYESRKKMYHYFKMKRKYTGKYLAQSNCNFFAKI